MNNFLVILLGTIVSILVTITTFPLGNFSQTGFSFHYLLANCYPESL